MVPTPITVVVPCYNEEDGLDYLAKTLDSFAWSVRDQYAVGIVLVDDGSLDGTWARLNELFGDRADCVLVRHQRNRGIAAATLTGIRHSRTEIVCAIDADCSFDPHQLKAMIPLLQPGVDVVVASPFHAQGRTLDVPGWRLALSKGASTLYRLVLRNKLSHYTSCFRVYRKSAVWHLRLRNERFVGITEILGLLDRQGSKIVECPAVLGRRVIGNSKMQLSRTILGHLLLLARLAYSSVEVTEIVHPGRSGGGLVAGPPERTPPGALDERRRECAADRIWDPPSSARPAQEETRASAGISACRTAAAYRIAGRRCKPPVRASAGHLPPASGRAADVRCTS